MSFPLSLWNCLSKVFHPLYAVIVCKGSEKYTSIYGVDARLNSLPSEYLRRMRLLLGDEYEAYRAGAGCPPFRGIRLNPLKCSAAVLQAALPFSLRRTPFSPFGYYLPAAADRIGRFPLHHAGAFYVQEPSAAAAVTALSPLPGEKILDLCAAPGGKSTQIAGRMEGKGLLWSNEVVRSRAEILLSNIERMGVRNAVVSCCRPEKLCRALAGYFDRVLVDAPCSGEGMFRRSEAAVQDWSPEHVRSCAVRQLAVLKSASEAVRQEGILVYSTCTFSREENEGVVSSFLAEQGGFELIDCGLLCGRPAFLPQARRIYPMDGGEGHFVAVLRRHSPNPCAVSSCRLEAARGGKEAEAFFRRIFRSGPSGTIRQVRDSLYRFPEALPRMDGLGVLRAGVLLGRLRPGRVEPEHALFMAARPQELSQVIALSHDSPQTAAFLRGEEIEVSPSLKGYAGVSVDGVMTGFGKCSGGWLKNHYPKGLRSHS